MCRLDETSSEKTSLISRTACTPPPLSVSVVLRLWLIDPCRRAIHLNLSPPLVHLTHDMVVFVILVPLPRTLGSRNCLLNHPDWIVLLPCFISSDMVITNIYRGSVLPIAATPEGSSGSAFVRTSRQGPEGRELVCSEDVQFPRNLLQSRAVSFLPTSASCPLPLETALICALSSLH